MPTTDEYADLARLVGTNRLAAVVTEVETGEAVPVPFATPAWVALLEWLLLHDIDPNWIPAGTLIERDGTARCIRYTGLVAGPDGRRRFKRDTTQPQRPNCDGEWDWPPVRDADGGLVLETLPMVQQGEAIAPLPAVIARWL